MSAPVDGNTPLDGLRHGTGTSPALLRLAADRARAAARAGDAEEAERILDDLHDDVLPAALAESESESESESEAEAAAEAQSAAGARAGVQAAAGAETAAEAPAEAAAAAHAEAADEAHAEAGSPVTQASGALPAAVAAVLDLRARLHAQRRQWAEADACWERVQRIRPDDPDAADGRRRIADIRAGNCRARPRFHAGQAVTALTAVTVAGALLLGGAVALDPPWSRTTAAAGGTGSGAPPAGLRELSEETQRRLTDQILGAVEKELSERDRLRTTAEERREQALRRTAEALTLPGTHVEQRDADVLVRFDIGLFPEGTELSPAGADALTRVARALALLAADEPGETDGPGDTDGPGPGETDGPGEADGPGDTDGPGPGETDGPGEADSPGEDAAGKPGEAAETEPQQGLHTTVVGHSVLVPGGRPGGGSPMALARARTAAAHLADAAGLPLTAFSLTSGDQRQGPHPDAARNRTVTLRVAVR